MLDRATVNVMVLWTQWYQSWPLFGIDDPLPMLRAVDGSSR